MLHGEAVTYARGDSISIAITLAIRGRENGDIETPLPGFRVGERSVDWLLTVADLTTAAGTAIEPQRGDTITTSGGEVFRVMPLTNDAPLWHWHDRAGRTIRRIHTKERS